MRSPSTASRSTSAASSARCSAWSRSSTLRPRPSAPHLGVRRTSPCCHDGHFRVVHPSARRSGDPVNPCIALPDTGVDLLPVLLLGVALLLAGAAFLLLTRRRGRAALGTLALTGI